MISVHVDPLAIAAPYMALSGLVGLLVGLVGGYWFGRRHVLRGGDVPLAASAARSVGEP